MATNPRFPEDRDVHPKIQEQLQPKGRVPWVLVAIIVAAVILIALILWLPRTPHQGMPPSSAQVPPQPTGDQIQFTHVRLVPPPAGNGTAVEAVLVNNGSTDITGAAVDATFKGNNGANLETIRAKIEGLEPNGGTQDLVQNPIKPAQERPVRMVFDRLPEGWNREMPALSVAAVTGTSNGSNALMPSIIKNQANQGTQGNKQAGQGTPSGSGAGTGNASQQQPPQQPPKK